jgi:hypothetical protein
LSACHPVTSHRIERDREDLLAEATALVERIELRLSDGAEHVIIGFRANGCGSVYFGAEEAYQFNTAGELRRAFREGELYKAERGRLVRLTRLRAENEVQLRRHDLDDAATATFLDHMASNLERLRLSLGQQSFRVVGQAPAGIDIVERAAAWVNDLPPGAIARTPHAR